MSSRYPQSTNKQIVRKDTDGRLSADAQLKNNMRYVYFKKVAQGGKCLIQSCKDLHLGRVVCHKTLRPQFADDPEEQRLFLREARVTAMLQHPNTAPVYEVGIDAHGHYYFTMKLVAGVTLHEVLNGLRHGDSDTTKTWDLERLIDVIVQVGQVLNYAHVHGIVHCDIKPENIVAGEFGEVLLLDWGLAEVHDEESPSSAEPSPKAEDTNALHSTASCQGTPQYMSPEQIKGGELDHRTDIYSLGAILFEVLTGQRLAWGMTLDDMLNNKINEGPPTPSIVAPEREIPVSLESLCLRCVQREPEHRIQTTLEVIHELLYWFRLDATGRPV